MLIVNLYYSLQDHLLLKTSKQLTVCIFYQSIHETLSSCSSDRWLRGGAVVVTSGSAGKEPLEQGRRMEARRSPGGLCCLEEGNSMGLQGWRGIEPRRLSALPRRDGEVPATIVSARPRARRRRGGRGRFCFTYVEAGRSSGLQPSPHAAPFVCCPRRRPIALCLPPPVN
jgi:hypothetical protein